MPKNSLNLSLDAEAIERGRRYSERHGTSISQVVNAFLASLPLEENVDDPGDDELPPTVRRLRGVARGGEGREAHRAHLIEKYGAEGDEA